MTNGFGSDMVNQNKIFIFKTKRQAKSVFPSDVERTVAPGKERIPDTVKLQ